MKKILLIYKRLLVTDDGSYDLEAFYKVKIVFIHPLHTFRQLVLERKVQFRNLSLLNWMFCAEVINVLACLRAWLACIFCAYVLKINGLKSLTIFEEELYH